MANHKYKYNKETLQIMNRRMEITTENIYKMDLDFEKLQISFVNYFIAKEELKRIRKYLGDLDKVLYENTLPIYDLKEKLNKDKYYVEDIKLAQKLQNYAFYINPFLDRCYILYSLKNQELRDIETKFLGILAVVISIIAVIIALK